MRDAETALFYRPRYMVTRYTCTIMFIRAVGKMLNLKKYILSKKQFIHEVLMTKAVR